MSLHLDIQGASAAPTGLVELRSKPCGLGHAAAIPSADERLRAQALCANLMAAIDAAAASTDYPVALEALRHKRGIVQRHLRWVNENDLSAAHALGMLGPNGYGPGIEAACRSARYHGFEWQARRAAMLAAMGR